jgi:hypothetical protein
VTGASKCVPREKAAPLPDAEQRGRCLAVRGWTFVLLQHAAGDARAGISRGIGAIVILAGMDDD